MPRSTVDIVWYTSPTVLAEQVGDMRASFLDILSEEMEAAAEEALDWMRGNHPWTNRTHQAENELAATVEDSGQVVTLENAAPHGIYLEFKYGGKWGVIRPALTATAPGFRDAMEATLHRTLVGG